MRILYDSKNLKFKSPFGTLKQNESCSIAVLVPQHCKTTSVYIKLKTAELKEAFCFKLYKEKEENDYEIYRCNFSIDKAGLYFYCFYIESEISNFNLYKEGFSDTNMEAGEHWQLSVIPQEFTVPKDFCGRVMYQIFPDRFYKEEILSAFGKQEPYYLINNTKEIPHFLPDDTGEVQNNGFYGGNIKGVIKKLPYLKKLGVGVIYLNPIFKAFSNHRYDTTDYKKIDELLGSEEDFKKLCQKAHKLNIKIILDGVFSHTGNRSIYFDEYNEFGTGVKSNPNSLYKNWFTLKSNGEYDSWWGIKTLPCVNELSEEFLNYIIYDEDSVIAHWLNLGADGFRLDVADELPDEFILALRNRLKKINKNALLLGEVWEDASNKISYNKRREYFTAGELDSVMNYPFKDAVIDFVLGKDDGSGFMNTVMTVAENYPKEVLHALMNMLSTHDTVRILTALNNKQIEEKGVRAAYKMSKSELTNAQNLLKIAAFLQFMLPGMPSIYYGDEIGTEGYEDPFCRSFFDWSKTQDNPLLDYFKSLTKLKNTRKELKCGFVEFIKAEKGVVIFNRKYKNKTLTVAVNLSCEDLILNAKTILLKENCDFCCGKIKIKPNGFALF